MLGRKRSLMNEERESNPNRPQLTVNQDEQCDEGDEEPVVRRLVRMLPLLPREKLSSVVVAVVKTRHAPPAGAGRVRVQVVVIVVVIVIIVVVIVVVH